MEVTSDHERCENCGGPLRRIRTSIHQPVGLMLGRPRVRLIQRACSVCSEPDSLSAYLQQVPPGGNYAYDLIVEVGLSRFCEQRQDAEIQKDLESRWGLSLPGSSIGVLGHSFLDGLAAVHQAHTPVLRQRLAEDGGYAMHVDGTCEPGTDVLFVAAAEPRRWILEVAKMPTENSQGIGKLMRSCTKRFGNPLAVVRDLSQNIENAKREEIPEARDLICHYHFLENVGEKLCEKPHAKLTTALRRLKVRPALRSLRKELVRWSRKGEQLSKAQIDHLLSHPEDIAELGPIALRRFLAYALLRWLDDYPADLQGEYFPFDLPSLAFYRRGVELGKMLSEIVDSPTFPRKDLSTLHTMARHLAPLREDTEVVGVAARLEKAANLFERLRKVLRLDHRPHEPILRGHGLTTGSEDKGDVVQVRRGLKKWRDQLEKRHEQESDKDKRADQQTVLNYLKKYEQQLVGHVIERQGQEPFVVCRTNNPAECRFSLIKRWARRKLGTKKLTRQVQAMRAEVALIQNLARSDYVDLVLDGNRANLPSEIAKHWHLVQSIRQQRQSPATERPIPVTKRQLRDPQFLQNIKQTVTTAIEAFVKKTCAA